MLKSLVILIILSLCVGAGVWLVFIWAVKRGEFDDVEGPKYRMLDEEETPPGEASSSQGENHDEK